MDDLGLPARPSSHVFRRVIGGLTCVGAILWIPVALPSFQWMLQGLAVIFVTLGLYDLLERRLVSVVRNAFFLTLGIGLERLARELASFGEFLTYSPLAGHVWATRHHPGRHNR